MSAPSAGPGDTTALRVGDALEEFTETLGAAEEPPVLTLTERNGFVRQDERFHKRLATTDVSKYKVIRENDFAFNPYLLWAGALALNSRFESGVISPLYPTFRVRDGYDPAYLRYVLLSGPMIQKYDSIAFGSVPRRRRSSVEDFLGLTLPAVPPEAEQRRIARILDHTDGLRAKRRAAIALLDDVVVAAYQKEFAADRHIARTTLEHVLVDGLSNGLSPATAGNITARVLTLSAVTSGVYRPAESREAEFAKKPSAAQLVAENSFLISRGNGNPELVGVGVVGRPDAEGRPLIFPDTVIGGVIDTRRAVPEFLAVAWRTPDVRAQIRSVARTTNGTYKVNQKGLGAITFPLPDPHDQERFAAEVRQVDTVRRRYQAHLAELDTLFASLQARAFRGDL
ncbi:restriction endonuclease subunit S [Streptomyces dangxiongensis]|uniref:Restriction endonuclease subunit S n=1 Tax=Streptomyces dangxiongensis TaxID=1442032 RepID=A0A3G2JAV6_9ACTN|nr:restriction endonuclease subunit S [Streptomyces dangxiongensis]AYN39436.1 restriction endonuclease subunit S [Streptomyces dangxiongensis]